MPTLKTFSAAATKLRLSVAPVIWSEKGSGDITSYGSMLLNHSPVMWITEFLKRYFAPDRMIVTTLVPRKKD